MKHSTSYFEAYAIVISLVCLWLRLSQRFRCAALALWQRVWTVPARTTSCGERLHCGLSDRKQTTVRTVRFFSALRSKLKPQCIERVYLLLLAKSPRQS